MCRLDVFFPACNLPYFVFHLATTVAELTPSANKAKMYAKLGKTQYRGIIFKQSLKFEHFV